MHTKVVLCLLVAISACGCSNQNNSKVGAASSPEFPASLAGVWQEQGGKGWQFTIGEDGQIESAIVQPGRVKMQPGKVSKFETRFGGKGVFEPGSWNLDYVPEARELSIEVSIAHFYQDLGADAMEGDSRDFFIGTVSEDAQYWEPDWYSSGQFTALVGYGPVKSEKEKEEVIFADVQEPEFRRTLIFEKVLQASENQ